MELFIPNIFSASSNDICRVLLAAALTDSAVTPDLCASA